MAIGEAILGVIQKRDGPTYPEVVDQVVRQTDATADAAPAELDALEREGLLYLVGDREGVRLP